MICKISYMQFNMAICMPSDAQIIAAHLQHINLQYTMTALLESILL